MKNSPEISPRLRDLLLRWGQLRKELDALEVEIKAEVMPLRQTVKCGDVIAAYTNGRGSYSWQQIADELGVPAEVIARHTKPVVDWRSACLEVGVPKALLEAYYAPGTPDVRVRLASEPEG